jgi:alpha-glucosidase (family GH31 glycosyl hydrolase)
MMMMMIMMMVALAMLSVCVIHSHKVDDEHHNNYTNHDTGGVSSTSCSVDNSMKADCGYFGIQESGCLSKGCCWYAVNDGGKTPWCFYGTQSSDMGYSLSDMKETSTGYVGILSLIGSGSSTYGEDIKQLTVEVIFETVDIVRVKITDSHAKRWEVPESVIPRPHTVKRPDNGDDGVALNYKFAYTESPFTFEVIRIKDGRSLFKLDSTLIYKNQYLEVTTAIDQEAYTYGLGESTRLNQALASDRTYTLWAADIAALGFNQNLYGSFPYYIQMVRGSAHGAMLMNSNGMDVTLSSNKLTFKPVGGIIDLYVFRYFQ